MWRIAKKLLSGVGVGLVGAGVIFNAQSQLVSTIEVRVVEVIDGDTYWVEPVATRFQVRLLNADTWESRRVRRSGSGRISDEEIAKGKAAKIAVESLLGGNVKVLLETKPSKNLESQERDSFGRVLGKIKVATKDDVIDVGDWLKNNGHVRN